MAPILAGNVCKIHFCHFINVIHKAQYTIRTLKLYNNIFILKIAPMFFNSAENSYIECHN